MNAFRAVVVGVADLQLARALWEGVFGFEEARDSDCTTQALAQRWRMDPGQISDTVLLRTPGADSGMVRLVAFSAPARAVREGAQAFDLCPKNLDLYVDDLALRLPELKAKGYRFRTENFSEVTAPNGVRFREIHMQGHDHVNIVLLQLLDESMHFSPRGFAGVGALVTIVEEPAAEVRWYEAHFAFETVAHHELAGPEIEAMIGLPSGAALDITILGTRGGHLGQIEVIRYGGLQGNNLYPRTAPPATGVLELELEGHPAPGSDQTGNVRSPAGMAIAVTG